MFSSPLKDGVIVLVILLLFFGPKRLPALSRAIGESVKEFKGGIAEATKDQDEKSDGKSELAAAPASQAVPTPAQEKTGEHAGTGSQSNAL